MREVLHVQMVFGLLLFKVDFIKLIYEFLIRILSEYEDDAVFVSCGFEVPLTFDDGFVLFGILFEFIEFHFAIIILLAMFCTHLVVFNLGAIF